MNDSMVLKNEGNLKKKRTTKWHGSTIKDILTNTAYTGRAAYNSKDDFGNVETIEITVPRLISDMTFELAQNGLETLATDAKRG